MSNNNTPAPSDNPHEPVLSAAQPAPPAPQTQSTDEIPSPKPNDLRGIPHDHKHRRLRATHSLQPAERHHHHADGLYDGSDRRRCP